MISLPIPHNSNTRNFALGLAIFLEHYPDLQLYAPRDSQDVIAIIQKDKKELSESTIQLLQSLGWNYKNYSEDFDWVYVSNIRM